jgi:hypothetical protein
MRRILVCVALITIAAAIRWAPASAAPRPPAPPPPAQGTITISYSGGGTAPWNPNTAGITGTTTVDLQYREVLHVTAGTYDKATGVMDLRGAATASYSRYASSDSIVPREVGAGCYTGSWTYTEHLFGWQKETAAGTYDSNSRRKVTMANDRAGTLHVGHYPDAYPDAPYGLPNADVVTYREEETRVGEYRGCEFSFACDYSFDPPRCGSDTSRTTSSSWSGIEVFFPDWYTSTPPQVPVALNRKGHLTGGGTFTLDHPTHPNAAPIPITLTVAVDVYFGPGLIADAGGPYTTTRGDTLTLDAGASRTTDGVAIRSYQWAWAAEPDCGSSVPINSPAPATTSPMRTIVPLCSLQLTLTVTDAKRRTATATTHVAVRKRQGQFAATPVTHTSSYGIPPEFGGDGPPNLSGFVAGVNVANCPNPAAVIAQPWICPAPTGAGTWQGNGYEMADVVDPGGPFDGFAYVASTSLTIDRAAYINSYLTPGGPPPAGYTENFYTANSNAGMSVDAFLAATEAHEGMGTTASPLGGHTGRARIALTRTGALGPLDPRQRVEGQFERTRAGLQGIVDALLTDNDHELCLATADPLPMIWAGTILFWDADALIPHWTPRYIPVGTLGTVDCS